MSDPDPPPAETPGPAPDGLELARALAKSVARARPATGGGRTSVPKSLRKKRTPRGSGGVSGAFPDERDPQTLDVSLGRLVEDHGWAVDLRVQGIFGRWAELVGEDVARHCQPESFGEGTLVVRTDSTAWATQMRLLAPTVVRRLNEELGHGTVTLIEVKAPHAPSWKRGPRSVRDGRGPRDTYG
jgi:predicted nucleic acid-binding Zn ribbon protein